MSLIKCPECGKDVSTLAEYCTNCGCPKSQFNCNDLEQENNDVDTIGCEPIEEITTVKLQQEDDKNSIPMKKTKALFILGVFFIVLLLIIIEIVAIPQSNAKQSYDTGINYMEDGDYLNAFQQFQYAMTFVDDYKDSNSRSIDCVQKLMDGKNYADAFKCITDNEFVVKQITVKEEDYADLCKFIDDRYISAFSKNRDEVHNDSIACYAIAANNVLPNDYGNVKVYINIGVAISASYAEYSDEEEFFISVTSLLCDTLKNHSEIDLLKRILEQDSLFVHFLSGETPDKRHEDYDGNSISFWYEPGSNTTRQFFLHGIGDGGFCKVGNWKDFKSPEADEADYYCIKNATYYASFADENREDIPEFAFTINSYSNITITSCTTNQKITMIRSNTLGVN